MYLKHCVNSRTIHGMTIEPVPVYDPADEAWRLLTAVMMARKEEFPAIAASFGLNPGAMHALLQLDPDEPQSMSSLAGAWKCDASNVTWLVDRLEEHGLAERRAHPGDRRIRTVALTRKGAKIRSQVEARIYEAPDTPARAQPARPRDAGQDPAQDRARRPTALALVPRFLVGPRIRAWWRPRPIGSSLRSTTHPGGAALGVADYVDNLLARVHRSTRR